MLQNKIASPNLQHKILRILYICGIAPEWPAALRPLPPIDSGAPHGNILRLVECLAVTPYRQQLEIIAVSAAATGQRDYIARKWPTGLLQGDYRQVTIPEWLRRWSAWLLRGLPITSGIFSQLWGAHSLQSMAYLRGLRRLYHRLSPDLVILDDAPQYIRGLAYFIPRHKLVFYCRGDMGNSRRFLHWPALVMVTNQDLGTWVQQINPQVARFAVTPNSLGEEYLNIPWNPERFHQTERIILFAGRMVPDKGLQYLLEAFSHIYTDCPEARLVIIGAEHPEASQAENVIYGDFESQMRSFAARRFPESKVEWRGWLQAAELQHEYQRAYLAVYPSTLVEGFGMVALEAMACGTPVIVSNRPGFAALAGQGGGLIVEDPTNVAELSQSMRTVLGNPPLAQNLGWQGYQIARRYSVDRAAESLVTALRSLSK